MHLDVYPKYEKLLDSRISNSTIIIVDVLRSTTCITWAVRNGAHKIIPAADPGEAAAIYGRLRQSDCLLAGEVRGVKHPDYHIGNSPAEFSRDIVDGKTIIMTTTNGTSAITGAKGAKALLIGAMINRVAVAKRAVELGNDIIVVCAGTDGAISADDLCAAGAICNAVKSVARTPVQETDIAFISRVIYKEWKAGQLDLSTTAHYSRLLELQFEDDIKFCFTPDVTNVVPEYRNGIIE